MRDPGAFGGKLEDAPWAADAALSVRREGAGSRFIVLNVTKWAALCYGRSVAAQPHAATSRVPSTHIEGSSPQPGLEAPQPASTLVGSKP